MAGERLGVRADECLVVEDAEAGVEAGLAAGMSVLAVGSAKAHPRATQKVEDLTQITADKILLANGANG